MIRGAFIGTKKRYCLILATDCPCFWIKFVQYHNQKNLPARSSIFALEMQPTPATDKTGFSHFTSYWQAYCSCIKSSTEKLNLYIALKTAPKATTTHITVSWLLGKCYRIIPQKLVVQAVLDSSRRERRAKSFTIWIHYQWNRRWSTPSAKKSFTTSWMEWFLVYGVYIIVF